MNLVITCGTLNIGCDWTRLGAFLPLNLAPKRIIKVKKTSKKRRVPRPPKSAGPFYESVPVHSSRPIFRSKGDVVTMRHSEFVDIIHLDVAFSCESHYINPGLSDSFPWLSNFANCYEMYRFTSLKYKYIPAIAHNLAGNIGMFVDYDAADPIATNAAFGLQNDCRVLSPSASACTLNVPTNRIGLQPYHFTRGGPVAAGCDIKTYDMGRVFFFAQGGTDANVVAGNVFVEYVVELIHPQPCEGNGCGVVKGAGTVTPAAPLGTAPTFSTLVPVMLDALETSRLIFKEPFEGVLTSKTVGTAITATSDLGFSPDVVWTLLDSVMDGVSGAATILLSYYKLIAPKGSTMTPHCHATTVTSNHFDFARGTYSQFT